MHYKDNYAMDGPGVIDFERIKQSHPLVDYCESHGIQLRKTSNRWIGKCPIHNERNREAFVIHPDGKWQCYGTCGRQGDVTDLERELYGGTIAEAAARLEGISPMGEIIPMPISRTPIGVSEIPKHLPTPDNPLALPYVLSDEQLNDCHRYSLRLLEDHTYVERISKYRQWKAKTIYQLALDGCLGLDDEKHFCFISAAGCKSRWREDGERRFKFLFGKSWLWRGELIPQAETIYLCEGETDAITLIDCGIEDDGKTAVIGMQGATFNIEAWSFLFANKDVVISTDYDEAGRKAAQKPCNDLCADKLLYELDNFLEQKPSDLLWINPYSAYLGADVKNSEANNLFLRTGLNPILKKHNCAAIIVHHTPKTNFNGTESYKTSDWMYRGSGSADITNWARAILVVDPCVNIGTYKFIAAKRGKRIGWGNDYPVYEEYFSHCRENDKLLWMPSTEDEIRSSRSSQRSAVIAKDLLPFIPDDEYASQEQIRTAFNSSGRTIGENRLPKLINELVTAGLICKISIPRNNARPEVKYRQA